MEVGLFSNKIWGFRQKKIDDLSPSYAGKMVVASFIIEGSSLKAYHMVKVEDFLGHWTAYYYITNSKKKNGETGLFMLSNIGNYN